MPPKDWSALNAEHIMQTDVVTVSESTPLSEVERLLSENRISGMPVTSETGHIVGVVSIRDLIERYTEDPDSRPRRGHGFYHLDTQDLLDDDFESFDLPPEAEEIAGDLMTAQIHAVAPNASVQKVAEAMVEIGIHRVLVQDGKKVVGLISTTDILAAVAGRIRKV